MNYQISTGQIIITLLILVGVSIGAYLVILLHRIAETIKKVNSILDYNKDNINNTMKSIPGICENVNEITGSVKRKTELIDGIFGENSEAAATSSSSAILGLESVISSLSALIEIFNEVRSFFGSKKKKIFKVKR